MRLLPTARVKFMVPLGMTIRLPENQWLEAACMADRETLVADKDFGFPQGAGISRNTKQRQFIRQYCVKCPILDLCREYGKNEEYGVWGGRTESERKSDLEFRRAFQRV